MLTVVIRAGILGFLLVSLGCERTYEDVRITVFDYRFIPDRVQVGIGNPVRVLIRNQGRETHRFKSSMLKVPGIKTSSDSGIKHEEIEEGIPVSPGKTIELFLTLPRGQYGFRCPIRGHQGMNGVFIVEKPDPDRP